MTAVVGKLFTALDCIAQEGGDAVSLAQLTQRTGIPKATLYRLLCDLLEAGVIERGRSGYSLGGRLFELGFAVPKYRRLRQLAQPYLNQLQGETGQTVHLGILAEDQVVVLEKVHGRSQVLIPTTVGSHHAAYGTAMGKMLLAHSGPDTVHRVLKAGLARITRCTIVSPGMLLQQLERYRLEGLAWEQEETCLGVGCLAAPVTGSTGEVVAAVSVAGEPRRLDTPAVRNRLRITADRVSRSLRLELAAS
ncbi:IclR family transcriptional regulator [Nocardia sp. NPDC004278]